MIAQRGDYIEVMCRVVDFVNLEEPTGMPQSMCPIEYKSVDDENNRVLNKYVLELRKYVEVKELSNARVNIKYHPTTQYEAQGILNSCDTQDEKRESQRAVRVSRKSIRFMFELFQSTLNNSVIRNSIQTPTIVTDVTSRLRNSTF